LPRHAAGHQPLRIDGFPVLKSARHRCDDFSMKGRRIDRRDSPLRLRLLVMTCDTPTPISASAGVPATKIRDRDRKRREFALGTMMRFGACRRRADRPSAGRPTPFLS